jgi:putative transposase
VVTPAQRRAAVTEAMTAAGISERQACRFTGFARSTQRYATRRPPRSELRARLQTLAELRPRWGYRRLYLLLRREGCGVNRKLVQRLYREEGLSVHRRKRKRVAVTRRLILAPSGPNERWSMDFVSDALGDGRKFRALTIVDDFTRESPAIEVEFSLTGERVARVLERLATTRGLPTTIVCDNGPEFQSLALDQWAHRRAVTLHFIEPGRPVQNAFAESFNGRLRDGTGSSAYPMRNTRSRHGGLTTTKFDRTASSRIEPQQHLQKRCAARHLHPHHDWTDTVSGAELGVTSFSI